MEYRRHACSCHMSHMSHMSIDVVISTHFFWLFSKLTWTLYPVSLALLPFWESRFPCLWVRTPFPSGVALVGYRRKLSLLVFVSLLRSLILLWWNHHFAWLHKSEFDASIHMYSNHSKGYTKNPSIQSTCSLHLHFWDAFHASRFSILGQASYAAIPWHPLLDLWRVKSERKHARWGPPSWFITRLNIAYGCLW